MHWWWGHACLQCGGDHWGWAMSASNVAEGAVGRRAGARPCTSRSHPVIEGHKLQAQQSPSAQATGNHIMELYPESQGLKHTCCVEVQGAELLVGSGGIRKSPGLRNWWEGTEGSEVMGP